MACGQLNRQSSVYVIRLTVCVCQIDSNCLDCCTYPKGYICRYMCAIAVISFSEALR
jgi:hypothetical protein